MAVIKDKILVIEDEKSINYLIGTVLTANGYDVIKAYTGTEACPFTRFMHYFHFIPLPGKLPKTGIIRKCDRFDRKW